MTHHASHRSSIAPRDGGGVAWSASRIERARLGGTGLFKQPNAAH